MNKIKKLAYQLKLRKKLNELDNELLEITYLETKDIWMRRTQSKKPGCLAKN